MKFAEEQLADLVSGSTYSDAAHLLAKILNGDVDPEEWVEETDTWVRQCYHRPSTGELQMHAANAIIGAHGVEAIRVEGEWIDRYHGDIVATYVNMGDPYIQTIVLDSETGEFHLTGYGDWLEQFEAERQEVSE